MKTITLFILFLMLFSFKGMAQWKGEHDITFPQTDVVDHKGVITQIKEAPQNIGRVQGVVGEVYSSEQIIRMGSRNINKISSMTLGVQSNGNQAPIFKGAEGGTAYFVDGVRIRSGGIGVAGFSY